MTPLSDPVQRLMDRYRALVIQGEKDIDPGKILRGKCRHCRRCRGRGCPDVLALRPAFEKAIRIEQFLWAYMTGLAELAREGRAPDLAWLRRLASRLGTTDLLDACLNAAASQEVRVRLLLPRAAAGDDDARNELMMQTFLWLRPQVSARLHGGAFDTLVGRVSSGELMGRWNERFLDTLAQFDPAAYPDSLVVGRFLDFAGCQQRDVFREALRGASRSPATTLDRRGSAPQLTDPALRPDERLLEKERQQHLPAVAQSVTRAVEQLPTPHRTVVQLIDFEGKDPGAVAARLGLTPESLKGYLAHARKLLKELVGIPADPNTRRPTADEETWP
jgi:hypothetical protein